MCDRRGVGTERSSSCSASRGRTVAADARSRSGGGSGRSTASPDLGVGNNAGSAVPPLQQTRSLGKTGTKLEDLPTSAQIINRDVVNQQGGVTPAFVIGNALFGYEEDTWGSSLNVKNFTNQRFYMQTNAAGATVGESLSAFFKILSNGESPRGCARWTSRPLRGIPGCRPRLQYSGAILFETAVTACGGITTVLCGDFVHFGHLSILEEHCRGVWQFP